LYQWEKGGANIFLCRVEPVEKKKGFQKTKTETHSGFENDLVGKKVMDPRKESVGRERLRSFWTGPEPKNTKTRRAMNLSRGTPQGVSTGTAGGVSGEKRLKIRDTGWPKSTSLAELNYFWHLRIFRKK